jgi:peptidoglycan/LPS O-acetylase OafA/YrhL
VKGQSRPNDLVGYYLCSGYNNSLLPISSRAKAAGSLTGCDRISQMSQTLATRLDSPRPDAIHGLTSLRFFAALYVVLFHSLTPMVAAVEQNRSFVKAISLGYASVSFFFFLSGYILSVAYPGSGRNLQNKKLFYSARFARIYPLYLLTLVLDTPDWFVAHARSFGGYVSAILPTSAMFGEHLLMLQAWMPWQRGIDRPNWSLSVEVFLYLLFPFAAIRIWNLSSRAIVVLAPALWIGGQLMLLLASGHLSIDALMFLPVSHLSTFLLGIALARWQSLNEQRIQSWSHWVVVSLLVTAGATTGVLLLWPDLFPRQYLNDGLLAPVFAQVILAVSINGRWPAILLGNRYLRELGDASYALYLFHLPIFHIVERLHLPRTWYVYAIYLFSCIGISVLSFRYFEAPWRFRIVKWLTRTSSPGHA